MLEYLDETFEEVQAKTSAYNVHPDESDEVLARLGGAVEAGETFDFEARLRRADGAYRWRRTRVFPMPDGEGEIDLWYGLCTDIDDRKWAETLLAGEKQLLSMVAQGVRSAEVLGALCGSSKTPRPAACAACSRSIPTASGFATAPVPAFRPPTTRCSMAWSWTATTGLAGWRRTRRAR